jgi:hypothetical protein
MQLVFEARRTFQRELAVGALALIRPVPPSSSAPVRGTPVRALAIGSVEGLEVELLDRLDHEPGEVILRQPVTQIRRKQ